MLWLKVAATALLALAVSGVVNVVPSGADPTYSALLPTGTSPQTVVIDQAAHRAYVAGTQSYCIDVYDLDTSTLVTCIPTMTTFSNGQEGQFQPQAVAVDPGTHRLYTDGYSAYGTEVEVMDTQSLTVVDTFPTNNDTLYPSIAVDTTRHRLILGGDVYSLVDHSFVGNYWPNAGTVYGLAIDQATDRLVALTYGQGVNPDSVVQFSLSTLTQVGPTVSAGPTYTTGFGVQYNSGVAVDPVTDTAVVCGQYGTWSVNLSSGALTQLASGWDGSPYYDVADNRVVVPENSGDVRVYDMSSTPPTSTVIDTVANPQWAAYDVAHNDAVLVHQSSQLSIVPLPTGTEAFAAALYPTSLSVEVSQSAEFTPYMGSVTTPVWAVNGIVGGNASVGTIAEGLYTAPATVPANPMVTVTAIDPNNGSVSASATVTIQPKPTITVIVTPSSVSLVAGRTQAYGAAVTGASDTRVAWSVDGVAGGNASLGTIDSTGLYTAPMTVPSPAAVAITATSLFDDVSSGSATATITPPTYSALLPTGMSPQTVAIDQTAHRAYVAGTQSDCVDVYDLDTSTHVTCVSTMTTFPGGGVDYFQPQAVAVDPGAHRLYTDGYTGTHGYQVEVFDTQSLTVVDTFPVNTLYPSIAVDTTNRQLILGGDVYNLDTDAFVGNYMEPAYYVFSVAINPATDRLVAFIAGGGTQPDSVQQFSLSTLAPVGPVVTGNFGAGFGYGGVTVDPVTDVAVVGSHYGTWQVDLATGALTQLSSARAGTPDYDVAGNRVLVPEYGGGLRVYDMSSTPPTSSVIESVANPLYAAYDVAHDDAVLVHQSSQLSIVPLPAPASSCTAPAITSPDPSPATVGASYTFTVTTCSATTPTITASGLPAGVTLTDNHNGTATISGTPIRGQGGVHHVTISAMVAGKPTAKQIANLSVYSAPAISSKNTVVVTAGTSFSFTVATKYGYPTPAITASALPSGVTLVDNGNGTATLSGTLSATEGGGYPITLTATNWIGGPVNQAFTLAVYQAPAVTSGNAITVTAGSASPAFGATATGYPAPAFKAVGLPRGLVLLKSGLLSGTPLTTDAGGVYAATVIASSKAGIGTQTFNVTLQNGPVFSSKNSYIAATGAPWSYAVTTKRAYPAPAISTTSSLPSGVTLVDNGDGTATLSGTPGTGGKYVIDISADNGIGPAAVQALTLTIDQAPSITSANNLTVTIGAHMTAFTVTTSGYPNPIFSSTGLPAGLALSATGVLSGTPRATDVPGVYTVTITATSIAGTTSQSFALTLTP